MLLTPYWPNFKGRFQKPCLTDANRYGDICPITICSGDIWPYQEYLSRYWLNFWPNLMGDSKKNWHQFFRTKSCYPKKVDHKFGGLKNVLHPKFFDPKLFYHGFFNLIFWTKTCWYLIFFRPTFFWIQKF